jgi:hypothetical protein
MSEALLTMNPGMVILTDSGRIRLSCKENHYNMGFLLDALEGILALGHTERGIKTPSLRTFKQILALADKYDVTTPFIHWFRSSYIPELLYYDDLYPLHAYGYVVELGVPDMITYTVSQFCDVDESLGHWDYDEVQTVGKRGYYLLVRGMHSFKDAENKEASDVKFDWHTFSKQHFTPED